MIRFLLFVFIYFVYHSAIGQSIIELQQVPLFLSPSFAGSDTSTRVVMATQRYIDKYEFAGEIKKSTNSVFFCSFDKMNSAKTKAFGAYASYQQNHISGNKFIDGFRNRISGPLTQYYYYRNLKTTLLEVGLTYVPKFFRFQRAGKSYFVTPAFLMTYSNGKVQEDHRNNVVFADSLYDQINPGYADKYSYLDNSKDTALGHKDINFHRVGLSGAVMFSSQRLFISYHLGFSIDAVSMDFSDFHYEGHYNYSSHPYSQQGDSSWRETIKNESDTYKRPYYNVTQVLSLGAHFPKRKNSFIQISPVAVISYNYSPIHSNYRPLLNNEYVYYVNSSWYDYTNAYGLAGRNFGLNVRVWKILAGISTGSNGYFSSATNYYLGYKAKKFTLTAGFLPNVIFNASLKLLL